MIWLLIAGLIGFVTKYQPVPAYIFMDEQNTWSEKKFQINELE